MGHFDLVQNYTFAPKMSMPVYILPNINLTPSLSMDPEPPRRLPVHPEAARPGGLSQPGNGLREPGPKQNRTPENDRLCD
jgi:hypothetical protein